MLPSFHENTRTETWNIILLTMVHTQKKSSTQFAAMLSQCITPAAAITWTWTRCTMQLRDTFSSNNHIEKKWYRISARHPVFYSWTDSFFYAVKWVVHSHHASLLHIHDMTDDGWLLSSYWIHPFTTACNHSSERKMLLVTFFWNRSDVWYGRNDRRKMWM